MLAFLIIFNVCRATSNNLPDANTRMADEKEYMDTLSEFIEQVDGVTAAYISGEMDKGAYLDRHNVLKNEYAIIKNEFNLWQSKHPYKAGTESYISARGEQAVKDANANVDNLLNCTVIDGEPLQIYELTYRYMDAKDKLQTSFVEYTVAYRWLSEKDTLEQDAQNIADDFDKALEELKETTTNDN